MGDSRNKREDTLNVQLGHASVTLSYRNPEPVVNQSATAGNGLGSWRRTSFFAFHALEQEIITTEEMWGESGLPFKEQTDARGSPNIEVLQDRTHSSCYGNNVG